MSKATKTQWNTILDALVGAKVFPGPCHRMLLWGTEPGTGKSSWASYKFGADKIERITIHEKMYPDELLGSLALVADPNGGTNTVWHDGYATRAMRVGHILVVDEIDRRNPSLEAALHCILDDWSIAGVTLMNGERVSPAKGYAVVATMNKPPSVLGAALLDRFDIVVQVNNPHPGAVESIKNKNVRNAVVNHYKRVKVLTWAPELSMRRGLAFDRLVATGLDKELAAVCAFGDGWQDHLNAFSAAGAA